MTQAKPSTVRLYFDEDVLGLAKLLCQKRPDFTYPGDPGGRIGRFERPACPITERGVRDDQWIPQVASRGWLIVTRDAKIQENRAEIAAVRDFGAKMVNLGVPDAGTLWLQLELFMIRWRDIDFLVDRPGPFIHTMLRTSTRVVELS